MDEQHVIFMAVNKQTRVFESKDKAEGWLKYNFISPGRYLLVTLDEWTEIKNLIYDKVRNQHEKLLARRNELIHLRDAGQEE